MSRFPMWDETRRRLQNIGALPLPKEVPTAEQPVMRCPHCCKEYDDFDGIGVTYCKPPDGCGFCRHISRSGKKRDGRTLMVCDACGHIKGEEESNA